MAEHKETSAIEMKLGRTASQFNALADRLMGALHTDHDEIENAIKEAKGFNLVSSKSTKMLPINSSKTHAYEGKLIA